MSQNKMIVIGVVVLLLAVVGVTLYVLLQSDAPVMTDGPGMLYFFSPT